MAEAFRLAYGHQFNPAFASEISRIDGADARAWARAGASARQDAQAGADKAVDGLLEEVAPDLKSG